MFPNWPSYFVLPPWCIKPPMIVLAVVHLKNGRDDSRGTVTTFLFMQMVHGMVFFWFVLQSFHRTP